LEVQKSVLEKEISESNKVIENTQRELDEAEQNIKRITEEIEQYQKQLEIWTIGHSSAQAIISIVSIVSSFSTLPGLVSIISTAATAAAQAVFSIGKVIIEGTIRKAQSELSKYEKQKANAKYTLDSELGRSLKAQKKLESNTDELTSCNSLLLLNQQNQQNHEAEITALEQRINLKLEDLKAVQVALADKESENNVLDLSKQGIQSKIYSLEKEKVNISKYLNETKDNMSELQKSCGDTLKKQS